MDENDEWTIGPISTSPTPPALPRKRAAAPSPTPRPPRLKGLTATRPERDADPPAAPSAPPAPDPGPGAGGSVTAPRRTDGLEAVSDVPAPVRAFPRAAAMACCAAAGLLLAALLGAGLWAAHATRERNALEQAQASCESSAGKLSAARKSLDKAIDSASGALKTAAKDVKDPKTIAALRKAAAARIPHAVECAATDKAGLDAAAGRADAAARKARASAKAIAGAVKAVESSRLGKTVDDANALYKATDGKVRDDKTREALKRAIAKRDAAAIARAVKAVNESKAAKEKADADAKAKAEQEAAEAASAAQQAQSAPRTGGSSSGGSSSNGTNGNYSYSGGSSGSRRPSGSSGGSSSSGSSSSSSSGGSSGWYVPPVEGDDNGLSDPTF